MAKSASNLGISAKWTRNSDAFQMAASVVRRAIIEGLTRFRSSTGDCRQPRLYGREISLQPRVLFSDFKHRLVLLEHMALKPGESLFDSVNAFVVGHDTSSWGGEGSSTREIPRTTGRWRTVETDLWK